MFLPKWVVKLVVAVLMMLAGFALWANWDLFSPEGTDEGQVASNDFPILLRTNGGLLEVATIKHRKSFNLTNSRTFLGFEMPFCRETASYTVDTYITYRIALKKDWAGDVRNGTLYMVAPALQPALPVAFDTDRLTETLQACPVMPSLNTRQKLQKSISAQLAADARQPTRIAFARDGNGQGGARKTVKEFLSKWAQKQTNYEIGRNTPIHVKFDDE